MSGSSIRHKPGAEPPRGFWVAAVVAIAGQMGLLVGAPSAPAAGGEGE